MYSLLIGIIYLAFISLGLPDSLLGSAWPVMRAQFSAPDSYAGVISLIITLGTIVSSLLSDRLTRKFGAGLVTALSVVLTAVALFGFSTSSAIWMLCLWAIPYGLGAGAVDAALNNYVALHYTSRHMNWLHSFWGVGAAVSPFIMGYSLSGGAGWTGGYRSVSLIQFAIAAVVIFSLPLWKKRSDQVSGQVTSKALTLPQIFRIPGVKFVLLAFFAYCAIETTAALWAASYLVGVRGVSAETAARFASFFYIGIMAGRFACGFAANKVGDKKMIQLGIAVTVVGIIAVALPFHFDWICLAGLIVTGLGCAPIYPAIIHSTPANFGADKSQAIVGVQMAAAYTGSALMPPLFGLLADHAGFALYPAALGIFAV